MDKSSSLSNLDSTSIGGNKRAQFPILPDINKKGSMGKSFQGHHSSSKRFVRERYNPPFKVNAKIRHVYTQEVTTVEGRDQQQSKQPHTVSCHRQTQTELKLFSESKQQRPEVEQISEGNELKEVEVEKERLDRSGQNLKLKIEDNRETDKRKVDASTSPIPSPSFRLSDGDTGSPFTGCSQMSVYPPLNYVKKLEDLEKITGHIVVHRFITKTDDAFGSWLEKQLGMTSKSVSVDTSEFENAKTAEIQDENDDEEKTNDDDANNADANENADNNEGQSVFVVKPQSLNDQSSEQEETILGAINNQGEGNLQETENERQSETLPLSINNANTDCTLQDPIKCECYLKDVDKSVENENDDLLKEIEEQIIPTNLTCLDSEKDQENFEENGAKNDDEVETLISTPIQNENNIKNLKSEEDIDEMVRCTLEAYLMAPMAFEDINEHDNQEASSPFGTIKSEVDSGRADSIRSQDKGSLDAYDEIEGNTSHDSVETVYEISVVPSKIVELQENAVETPLSNDPPAHVLLRSLSADSCIGTESSGEAKNPATNASQSSNDTIEGVEPFLNTKEIANADLPVSTPPTPTIPKLPTINPSMRSITVRSKIGSAKSHRSLTPSSATGAIRNTCRRNEKTDNTESEDADGESETESEITDNLLITAKLNKHQQDGTDLELEEVEEYEGDDDDRDAFDTMVANHLKYSRGFSTGTSRRSRLNRGTQTTRSIEPSTTSGSLSPSSSSNSSFDVEIVSKSKRITTTSSSTAGINNPDQRGMITPSNMSLAWHDGGRRRSYLPSSSSSLNLLNMKFSLGKDFESEVSIRMPTNKSSSNTTLPSASMLLPGSGEPSGRKTLLSSSTRTHHHSYYANRGLSPGRQSSSQLHHPPESNNNNSHEIFPSVPTTATSFPTMPSAITAEPTELQSLWKDVRSKLDVQVDEISGTAPEEEDAQPPSESLHVRGNGILPVDPPGSGSTSLKLRRNEERIKRSLQRLKKILDD